MILITSSYQCMVEKVLFLVRIFEVKIWMDWIYMFSSPVNKKKKKKKKKIAVGLCVQVYFCYQHNSKINHSRNSKFVILYLYNM